MIASRLKALKQTFYLSNRRDQCALTYYGCQRHYLLALAYADSALSGDGVFRTVT